MNTCTCYRGPEGFTYDPELDMWVHVTCGLPTEPNANRVLLEELL